MEQKKLDFKKASEICIVSTLDRLGFFPTKKNSKEAWYLSPLRLENNASFKVSLRKNKWYDFGTGKGGDVIELIRELKQFSAKEALDFLSQETLPFSAPEDPETIDHDNGGIRIFRIRNLSHPRLIKYVRDRRIRIKVARKYCREVWFRLYGKKHFCVGLRNNLGGWELRNKYLKFSSSPKTFTFLKRSSERLILTEGMFDFLSLAVLEEELAGSSDVIVLNSIAFVDAVKPFIGDYREAFLYLDNDIAGRRATKEFSQFHNITDRSSLYRDHKDLNEMIMDRSSAGNTGRNTGDRKN